MQRAVYRHNLARNMGVGFFIFRTNMSRFWAGLGFIRKRKVQCGAVCSWFNEIVLISNDMSIDEV